MTIHPHFTAWGKSSGTRKFAASLVHEAALDIAGRHHVITDYRDGLALVKIRTSRWYWLALGLYHLRLWWKVRRAALRHIRPLRLDLTLKVNVR